MTPQELQAWVAEAKTILNRIRSEIAEAKAELLTETEGEQQQGQGNDPPANGG